MAFPRILDALRALFLPEPQFCLLHAVVGLLAPGELLSCPLIVDAAIFFQVDVAVVLADVFQRVVLQHVRNLQLQRCRQPGHGGALLLSTTGQGFEAELWSVVVGVVPVFGKLLAT